MTKYLIVTQAFLFLLLVLIFVSFLQSVELPRREEFPILMVTFESIEKNQFAVISFQNEKIEFSFQFRFLIQLSNTEPLVYLFHLVLSFSVSDISLRRLIFFRSPKNRIWTRTRTRILDPRKKGSLKKWTHWKNRTSKTENVAIYFKSYERQC